MIHPLFKYTLPLGIIVIFLASCQEDKIESKSQTNTPTPIVAEKIKPSNSQEQPNHSQTQALLTQVETKYVCMVNNELFKKVQIPVEFEGRTYYGCCQGCVGTPKTKIEARTAKDPLTHEVVDKSKAVIGALPDGKVLYFANAKNFEEFQKQHL